MPIHDWTRIHPEVYHGFHVAWVVHLTERLNTGGLPTDYYADIEPTTGERSAVQPKPRQRRVIVRHMTGHRVVARVELVTPGNKACRRKVNEFARQAREAIEHGIHVTILDLFQPTPAVPRGLSSLIGRRYDREPILPPIDRPLVFAAFTAPTPDVVFEFRGVGEELPAFPVMLSAPQGVMLPLAETYAAAFDGGPPYLRDLLSIPA